MWRKALSLVAAIFMFIFLSSTQWGAMTHAQDAAPASGEPSSPARDVRTAPDLSPLAHTETKLLQETPTNNQKFGTVVDIYGNYAIVGSQHEEASIYQWNGSSWVLVETKQNPGSTSNFGKAVAINNSYAVIGADGDESSPGAVYIYERLGEDWSYMDTITPTNGLAEYLFGQTVAISGEFIAIGAPGDNEVGNGNGAVYVYTRLLNAWVLFKKLIVSNSTKLHLGRSVDIDGNRVVAGNNGEAYVFEHDNGIWDAPMPSTPPETVDGNYGISVSISGGDAVVGSPMDNQVANDAGAVYLFRLSNGNWNFNTKLIALDTANVDHFGQSVDMDGRYIIVGADDDDNAMGVGAGTAYIFRQENGSWVERSKLTASDGFANARLGSAVAVSNYRVLVGAPFADGENTGQSGSAYVYALDFAPTVDVRANGQAETAVVPAGSGTTFSATIDPGTKTGQQAEWWVGLSTPVGTLWKNSNGWTPSITPVMLTQSPLPATWSLDVPLNLPASTYTLFVVLDTNINGVMDSTWTGSATSVVLPAGANAEVTMNDILAELMPAISK